jgi:hypothetical protein
MFIGYFYTILRDITELGLFSVLFNGLLTILAIGILKMISLKFSKQNDDPVTFDY